MSKNTSSVSEKTLKVLFLFSKHKSLTINKIVDLTEMNISSVYRIINTLRNQEFIMLDSENNYILNPAVILPLYNMVNTDLRANIKPFLKRLADSLNASVFLSKDHRDNQIIIVEKEDGPGNLRWVESIGFTYNIPTGTAGKTHLAYILKGMDEHERKSYLKSLKLVHYTDKSIVDLKILLEDIQEILINGYCITEGEHLEEVVGFSVPILNPNSGECMYILTLIRTSNEFNIEEKQKIIISMKEEASRIASYII